MENTQIEFKTTYIGVVNNKKVRVYRLKNGGLCNADDCTTEYKLKDVDIIGKEK